METIQCPKQIHHSILAVPVKDIAKLPIDTEKYLFTVVQLDTMPKGQETANKGVTTALIILPKFCPGPMSHVQT